LGLLRRTRKPLPGPLLPPEIVPPAPRASFRRLGRALATPLRVYVRAWRRVQPTGEGWIFMATSLAVALAALNTGNNLLYLVFAAMLSLVVLSGVLSESSLRGVEVRRRIHGGVFAGLPARGTWIVRSRRRRLPNLALDFEELPGRYARLGQRGEATLPYLRAGAEERRLGTWTFEARGIHRLGRVRVSTTWPFGILRKWFEVEIPGDVLVFPAPASDWEAAMAPLRGRDEGALVRARRGATGDMRGLRDHRPGEELRSVHWRTSARLGRRVVVERDADEGGRFEVRVATPPAGEHRLRLEQFERSVSQAAGAVVAATDRGDEVVLHLGGTASPPLSGPEGRDRLLRRLAVTPLDRS